MASAQLSLHHLVRFPASFRNQEPNSLYPTILALHGRGSNEQDLIELAPQLPDDLLWISPRAPLILGPDSYEWYRVRVIGRPDPERVYPHLKQYIILLMKSSPHTQLILKNYFYLGLVREVFFPCVTH